MKDGRGRIFVVDGETHRDDTEGRQKEKKTNDGGQQNAGKSTARDLAQIFATGDTGVDQAMSTGKCNISADRAANERNDSKRIDLLGQKCAMGGLEQRRMRGIDDIPDQAEHDDAENFDKQVHRPSGLFEKEKTDRESGAHDRTVLDRNVEYRV